ncbi:MAG: hypothetical protein HY461_00035 [Parcubacteria group bacterium]|nr:hypothetical protein [Parcubacteria group bacterium]
MAKAGSVQYALLLDSNTRCFAVVPWPKAGPLRFTALPGRDAAWAEVVAAGLKRSKINPSQLSRIEVCQGTGSFSDTRAVVLLANLFSRFAATPIVAVGKDDDWLAPDRAAQPLFLQPKYYAEPNITQAKK